MTAAQAAQRKEFMQAVTRNNYTLLGEVIAWDLPINTRIKYPSLIQALQVAGLVEPGKEKKLARELLPRYAFARAAKHMSEDRIIRPLADTKEHLSFQFTKEYLAGDQYQYDMEAILILDKQTGAITVTDPAAEPLAEKARGLLAQATEDRNTADISRVIKRMFELSADLFPVREAGAVYFVPDRHSDFVDKIETFVRQLNGRLTRFPVPAGSKGDQSVNEAVANGLQAMLDEHKQAIEEFDLDTRTGTMERHLAKIEKTKFKIECYASYLTQTRQDLDERLDELKQELREKLNQAFAVKQATNG